MEREAAAVIVLCRAGAEVASWPLEGPSPVDLSVVDDLAKLQLAARRLGFSIRIRGACAELAELLELVGLDVELQVLGDAEGGEESRIAVDDEVVDGGDPVS